MSKSDRRRVEIDIRRAENSTRRGGVMSASTSTALKQSADYLVALTRMQHRGRGDTWGAARDRAAKLAGIERSYAKRLWDRWQTMNDVSGEVYLRLREAYEELCLKNEAAAEGYKAERLKLKATRHEINQEPAPEGRGAADALGREVEMEEDNS